MCWTKPDRVKCRHVLKSAGFALLYSSVGWGDSLYIAPMDASRWLSAKSATSCELRHPVPDFGNAIFTYRNNGDLGFKLESVWPFKAKEQRGQLLVLSPPWRHLPPDPRRVEVKLDGDDAPLEVSADISRWLLASIEKGGMASLRFEQAGDAPQWVRVSLSPVNFLPAYGEFLACIPTLPEPPPPQYTLQQAGFWYPHFDTDSYRLSKSNEQMLSTLAEYLKQHEEIEHLEIRGYADDTGKEKYNLALSEKRAAAVQQWLLEREVAAARLLSRHFGESEPASQGKTPQARAMNRRVELEFHYREASATPSAANTAKDQAPEQSAE
jgi:hypothetical protein